MVGMNDLTKILQNLEWGSAADTGNLFQLVYDELRKLANNQLQNESPVHTLQPTALVHEAYLRLVGPANAQGFSNRRHFFGAAAEAMRRILVDNARKKKRLKRGGEAHRIEGVDMLADNPADLDNLLDLDDALTALAQEDSTKAELVKLRYFGGLDEAAAAECLQISRATASRYWTYARAWLFDRLRSMDSTISKKA